MSWRIKFLDLPDEVIQTILSLATVSSRIRMRTVSRSMRTLSDSDPVWLPQLQREFNVNPESVPEGRARELLLQYILPNAILRASRFTRECEVLRSSNRVFNAQSARNYLVCAMGEKDVRVLHFQQGKFQHHTAFPVSDRVYDVYSLASEDSVRAVASVSDGTAHVLDVHRGKPLFHYTHAASTPLFASFLDRQCAYSGGFDCRLVAVDLHTQQVRHDFCAFSDVMSIRSAVPTGERSDVLYLGLTDSFCVWDARTNKDERVISLPGSSYIWRLHVDPGGAQAVALAISGRIHLLDLRRSQRLHSIELGSQARGLLVDTEVMAAGTESGQVLCFDRTSFAPRWTLPAAEGKIVCSMAAVGGWLVLGGWDDALHAWRPAAS